MDYIILRWIVNRWRRRELNSLSNRSMFHDYFFEILRHTPNRYPENAGCHRTALRTPRPYCTSVCFRKVTIAKIILSPACRRESFHDITNIPETTKPLLVHPAASAHWHRYSHTPELPSFPDVPGGACPHTVRWCPSRKTALPESMYQAGDHRSLLQGNDQLPQ